MRQWAWAVVAAAAVAGPAAADDFKPVKRPPVQDTQDCKDRRSGAKETCIRGTTTVTDANKILFESVAQWLVYRLTHPEYHGDNDGPTVSKTTMNDLVREAVTQYMLPAPTVSGRIGGAGAEELRTFQNQLDYAREFGKAMEVCLKEVLTHRKDIVKVNAGRLLAELGKSGYFELGDTCAALIADEKTPDVVRLFALKALNNLFAVPSPEEPNNPSRGVWPKKESAREAKVIAAVANFLAKPVQFPAGTPQEEIDGYRFVRREAVRVLGRCRRAVAKGDNDAVLARPAVLLLKVALKDGLTPQPGVGERIDGLVGFCQLPPDPGMNPEATAYYLALGAQEVARELQMAQNKQSPEGVVPWKLEGAKLVNAVTAWQAGVAASNLPAEKQALLKEAATLVMDQVVRPIEQRGGAAQLENLQALTTWIGGHTPANAALFTGVADTAIKAPDAGG